MNLGRGILGNGFNFGPRQTKSRQDLDDFSMSTWWGCIRDVLFPDSPITRKAPRPNAWR